MNWKSRKEMLAFYKIDLPENDLEGIRKKLLKILSSCHPDKTGGKFTSAKQKKKYEDIQHAIAELNNPATQETSLMVNKKINELIVQLAKVSTHNYENQRNLEKNNLKKDLKENIKSRYFPIKITSGSFGAIVIGLFSFGKSIKEIDFLAPILSIPYLNFFLINILMLSTLLFIYTFIKEKKEETAKEWLFSENAKIEILRNTILQSDRNLEGNYIFSFNNFLSNISYNMDNSYRRDINLSKNFVLLYKSPLTISLIEQIAKHHLADLENRGVIKKSNTKSLDIIYELDKEFENQIKYHY